MHRPRLVPVFFGLAIVWLVVVVALVAHDPDQGAPTPDRLASEYGRALRTHDTTELHRDAPGVPIPPCANPTVTAVRATGTTWLEVDDSHGRRCARLSTTHTHGWWTAH